MAGNIEGQRDRDTDHSGYAFQTVVYVVAGFAVDAALVRYLITDDREQVNALVFRIFVKDRLHIRSPFYY